MYFGLTDPASQGLRMLPKRTSQPAHIKEDATTTSEEQLSRKTKTRSSELWHHFQEGPRLMARRFESPNTQTYRCRTAQLTVLPYMDRVFQDGDHRSHSRPRLPKHRRLSWEYSLQETGLRLTRKATQAMAVFIKKTASEREREREKESE